MFRKPASRVSQANKRNAVAGQRNRQRFIPRRATRDDAKLAAYWGTDYDWRKVEGRLNALPQFVTEIDGLDVHFIHVRSKHEMRCR